MSDSPPDFVSDIDPVPWKYSEPLSLALNITPVKNSKGPQLIHSSIYGLLALVNPTGIEVISSKSAYGKHIQDGSEGERHCTIEPTAPVHSIYFTSDELRIVCLLEGTQQLEVYRVADGTRTANLTIEAGIISVAPSKQAPHLLCITTPTQLIILDSTDLSSLAKYPVTNAQVDWEEESDCLVAVSQDGKIVMLDFDEDGRQIAETEEQQLFDVDYEYEVLKVLSISPSDFFVCLLDVSGSEIFPFFGHFLEDGGTLEWSAGLSFMTSNDVEVKQVFCQFYADMNALVIASNQDVAVEIYRLYDTENGLDRWKRFNFSPDDFGLPGSDALRGLALDLTDVNGAPVLVALTEEQIIARSFEESEEEWKGLRQVIDLPAPKKLSSSSSSSQAQIAPASTQEAPPTSDSNETTEEDESHTASKSSESAPVGSTPASRGSFGVSSPFGAGFAKAAGTQPTPPTNTFGFAKAAAALPNTKPIGFPNATSAGPAKTPSTTFQPSSFTGFAKQNLGFGGGSAPAKAQFFGPPLGVSNASAESKFQASQDAQKLGPPPGAGVSNATEAQKAQAAHDAALLGPPPGATGASAPSKLQTTSLMSPSNPSFGISSATDAQKAQAARDAAMLGPPPGVSSASEASKLQAAKDAQLLGPPPGVSGASEASKLQAAKDAQLLGAPPGVSSASEESKRQAAKDASLLGPPPGAFKSSMPIAAPIAAKPSTSLPTSLSPAASSLTAPKPTTLGFGKPTGAVGFGSSTGFGFGPKAPESPSPITASLPVQKQGETVKAAAQVDLPLSDSDSEEDQDESGSTGSHEMSDHDEGDEEEALKGIQELQFKKESPPTTHPKITPLQSDTASSAKVNGFGPVIAKPVAVLPPSTQLGQKEIAKPTESLPAKDALARPTPSSTQSSTSSLSSASMDKIKTSGNEKSASGSDVSSLFSMLLETSAKQMATRQEYVAQLTALVSSVTAGSAKLSEPKLFRLSDELDARLKALDDWSSALRKNIQHSKTLLSEVDGLEFMLEQSALIWNTGQLDSPDLHDEELNRRAQLRGSVLGVDRLLSSLNLKRSEVERYLSKAKHNEQQPKSPFHSMRALEPQAHTSPISARDTRIPSHLQPVQLQPTSPAPKMQQQPSSLASPSRSKPTLTQQVVLHSRKLQDLSNIVKQLESQLRTLNQSAALYPSSAFIADSASLTPVAVERTTLDNYAPETWNPKAIQQVGKQAKWVQLEQPMWINSGRLSSTASAASQSALSVGLKSTSQAQEGSSIRRSSSKNLLTRTRQDNPVSIVSSLSSGSGGVGILRSTLRSSQIVGLKKSRSKSSHGSLHSDEAFSDFEEDEEEVTSNSDSDVPVDHGNYSFGIKKRAIKPLPASLLPSVTPASATSTSPSKTSASTSSFGVRVPLTAPSTAQKPVDPSNKPPPAPLSPPFQPAKTVAAPPTLDLNATPTAEKPTTAPAKATTAAPAKVGAPTETAAPASDQAASPKVGIAAVGPKFSTIPKIGAPATAKNPAQAPVATAASAKTAPTAAAPVAQAPTASPAAPAPGVQSTTAAQTAASPTSPAAASAGVPKIMPKFTGFAKPTASQTTAEAPTAKPVASTGVAAAPKSFTSANWPKPAPKATAPVAAAPAPAPEPTPTPQEEALDGSEEVGEDTELDEETTPRDEEVGGASTPPSSVAPVAAPAPAKAPVAAVPSPAKASTAASLPGAQPKMGFGGFAKSTSAPPQQPASQGAATGAATTATANPSPGTVKVAPAPAKQMFVPAAWGKQQATAPAAAPAAAAPAASGAASTTQPPASTAAAAPKGTFGFGATPKGTFGFGAASPVTQPATPATASPATAPHAQPTAQQPVQQGQQPAAKQTGGWGGSGFGAKPTGFPSQQQASSQAQATTQAPSATGFAKPTGFGTGTGFGQQQAAQPATGFNAGGFGAQQTQQQQGAAKQTGFGGTQTGFQQQQAGAGWMQRGQAAKPTTAAPAAAPSSSFGSGFAQAGAGGGGWAQSGFSHSFAGGAQQSAQQSTGGGGGFGQRAQLGAGSSFAAAAKPTGGLPASFGSGFSGKGTGGGFSGNTSPGGGWAQGNQASPMGGGNYTSARR